MAPEQIRGEGADARSDLFSFGALVYELASGKRAFTGHTFADVSSAILRDSPPLLTSTRSDVPADLARIIERCLEKSPRERFQTALDVANELRGLKRTLERWVAPPSRPASDTVASIAVLPFVNRSASTDDEYFSDGLADELLNVLARIKGLRVTARTSSFHFKGKDTTIAEIGRVLNVATVLEGSVRKAGTRVRISVQLVKVSDSSHLWSETYDRTLDDIFAVQDDVAQSVVKELRTSLLGEEADSDMSGQAKAEVAQAAKGRGSDPEAHRLYLLARHLIDRLTREETTKSIGYLKEALARDPTFALGWAELGWAHIREANAGWAPVVEGYRRAREAVERALELEPNLPEAHARMGWIRLMHDWDFSGAEALYARALELMPANADVLRGAGVLARTRGRTNDAIDYYHRALEQDPLSAATYHSLGLTLHLSDRNAEAEDPCRKALELAPQRLSTNALLSMVLLAQGRRDEALAAASREPEDAFRFWALAIVRDALGQRGESDTALEELIEKFADSAAIQVAEVYASRSELDLTFQWLERAYVQRDAGLISTCISPRFRSLYGDRRWGAFLEKMDLAGQSLT
jgi:TolB-like protein/Tfp pilus assembly protein PilF